VAPVTVLVTSAIVVALEVEMEVWADAMATRHKEKRTISNFIVERGRWWR
jgi:hypothetical protein